MHLMSLDIASSQRLAQAATLDRVATLAAIHDCNRAVSGNRK